MKTQKHKTWILVADGAQARILLNTGRMDGVQQVPEGTFRDFHEPSRELGTHRPPRTQESFGAARHAIEPRTDLHEHRKEVFLSGIAEFLKNSHRKKEFEHLILVAPAVALGKLRKILNAQVSKSVIAELVHDYVHQSNDTIYQHVKSRLPL
jgi:protein required for attachment to host cells